MSEENKTMIIRNKSDNTEELHYPVRLDFRPGEEVEVSYSIGQDLIKQRWAVEVKRKKERTPDRKAAESKKKVKE